MTGRSPPHARDREARHHRGIFALRRLAGTVDVEVPERDGRHTVAPPQPGAIDLGGELARRVRATRSRRHGLTQRELALVAVDAAAGSAHHDGARLAGREQHVERAADVDLGEQGGFVHRPGHGPFRALVVDRGATSGSRDHGGLDRGGRLARTRLRASRRGRRRVFSERSSRPTTVSPSATSRRHRCEPMNPAAPVTSTRSALMAAGYPPRAREPRKRRHHGCPVTVEDGGTMPHSHASLDLRLRRERRALVGGRSLDWIPLSDRRS